MSESPGSPRRCVYCARVVQGLHWCNEMPPDAKEGQATLRDWFAVQVLLAQIASPQRIGVDAEEAYRVADDMMVQRRKVP